MNDSPVKFIGAASRALGVQGIGGLGAISSLFGRKGRRRERYKSLEKRVTALEGGDSQNTQVKPMNAALAARSGYVQGTVPPATSSVAGALGGGLGVETVSGVGQFNPGTMQVDNNALSSDPLEGINKIPEIISAPGPITGSQDELSQLFQN
jgi:hypothetical protein